MNTRSYESPKLTVHGDIAALTGVVGGNGQGDTFILNTNIVVDDEFKNDKSLDCNITSTGSVGEAVINSTLPGNTDETLCRDFFENTYVPGLED